MHNQTIRRGDIYYIISNYAEEGSEQRSGRPAIIVSNDFANEFSEVVEVVYLTTRNKTTLPTHCDINSSLRKSTALCEQIASVCKNRLGTHVGVCSDEEIEQINRCLAISLGLSTEPQECPTCDDSSKAVTEDTVQDTPESGVEAVQTLEEPISRQYELQLAALQAQCDVYKEQFESLLHKMLAGTTAV